MCEGGWGGGGRSVIGETTIFHSPVRGACSKHSRSGLSRPQALRYKLSVMSICPTFHTLHST